MKTIGPPSLDPGVWLDLLRERGVTKARLKDGNFELEVEFAPAPAPLGLVDKDGKPVDLDEGMGMLEGVEERDDPIHAKNFPKAIT